MSRNFSNEQFSINLEEQSGCVVSAVVKTTPQLLDKLHKQAIKKIKKDVVLSGFRKGKAPDEIIVSRYPSQATRELNQLLIQAAYQALSTVGDRRPLSPQAIKSTSVAKADLAEGGQVDFTYEAFPVIADISWDKLSLAKEAPIKDITDEEMEKGLLNISYFFATKTPVTRPSQEGDFVSLSLYVSKQDEERTPTAIFENKYFKLCEEEMTDSFKAKFLGISAGHRVTEIITSPDIQSFLNGDVLTFTVNAVIEVVAPELDDEKARQLQAESLEDLKKKLRIQLENQAKDKQHQQRFTEAENALANIIDFDLPTSMLEDRLATLTREKLLNARLIQYCSDEELEDKKSDLLQEAEAEAKKTLKLFFLANKIFTDEKLVISREELQYMMDVCSRERYGMQPPRDISNEALQELVMAARDRLTYHKAMETVLSKAKELATAPSA
ncbi:Trigger factor,trigger factor,FKBP-type peptidyl-prolyl cis-trans isomerase (trigger factor),trigger factor,Bacterial trigger factor protein (TF) [Chlamydia poikilotherma]|uniref:Trigger factor n=1 Tax=Chlamydia poikilotherma TaxID=1967783 RepID=A0A3B0PT75_9CHLA|nr:trigger factor [Chlamydia poikilotherma]SYX09378.1 Trigger factor,trigger factor,FKBP-type peptidyl-prolyl cis-trans isomerase (trigger factor),trigger factor,Bacterial trigger factor protein (TF) [Chlamydia poikilotherma]